MSKLKFHESKLEIVSQLCHVFIVTASANNKHRSVTTDSIDIRVATLIFRVKWQTSPLSYARKIKLKSLQFTGFGSERKISIIDKYLSEKGTELIVASEVWRRPKSIDIIRRLTFIGTNEKRVLQIVQIIAISPWFSC